MTDTIEHTDGAAGVDAIPGFAAGADADTDMGAIMPTPGFVTLVGTPGMAQGMKVAIKPLRSRELFKLLRIVTVGLGPQIAATHLDPDEDSTVFLGRFAGMLLTALPAAEDEVMAFLRAVVQPAALVVDGRPDKAVEARNKALNAALDAELDNPLPDDTVSIIEALAAQESGDLQALGKRIARVVGLARRTGQIPSPPTSRA